MTTIESWSESDGKSLVNREDEIIRRWQKYNRKEDLCEAIETTISEIKIAEIKKIYKINW